MCMCGQPNQHHRFFLVKMLRPLQCSNRIIIILWSLGPGVWGIESKKCVSIANK